MTSTALDDQSLMQLALLEAEEAALQGEVPVGAVVAQHGVVIATAHNLREHTKDPTAHAELLALRRAADYLGRWRLSGCSLFVTLEPCAMCAGALVNARIERLVYGAADVRSGAVTSLFGLVGDPRLNHRVEVVSGVLADESASLLRSFFAARRKMATAPL